MIAGARLRNGARRAAPAPATQPRPASRERAFVERLESRGRSIQDPVAKLRFLRSSLARYQAIDRTVGTVIPWTPVRRWLYWALSLRGLREALSMSSLAGPARPLAQARASMLRQRGMRAGLLIGLAVVVGVTSWRGLRQPPPAAAATRALPPVAEELPPLSGVAPQAVWLVEKGEGWEEYSNGLRVDTSYAVVGDPRSYRVFLEDGSLLDPVHDEPVGILFHTSESDVWPLEATFNENLRDSTQRLLRYVQRGRLYHYLIDRFGRVYRLVAETSKANHAGHSVWARDGKVYLNLNHAFVGISFETRWEGGRALPITRAQLAAGRNLTEFVKQRWKIAPEMCVTHGLTSVNPKKRLIGHHLDWARGFPFSAFGLPDQYGRPAPSVALFGFGYDGDFLKVLGEPWAGVAAAERVLAEQASRQGRALEEYRLERQALYERWFAEQARDEEARAAARAERGRRLGDSSAGIGAAEPSGAKGPR
jgi:hypothetical protein